MADLLLAEHDYQVADFLERGVSGIAEWVALGPSAMAALENRGIKYVIPEDFHSPDELTAICLETHSCVMELCDLLDGQLHQANPELREMECYPFRFSVFGLMMLFDSIRGRIFQLRRIFDAFPKHRLHVHRGPEHADRFFEVEFSLRDTIWGRVASLPDWGRTLLTYPEPTPGQKTSSSGSRLEAWKSALKRRVLRSPILGTLCQLLMRRDWVGLWSLVRKNDANYLVTGGLYDWKYVIPLLRSVGCRSLQVSPEYFASNAELDRNVRKRDGDGPNLAATIGARILRIAGVDFASLVESRLQWIWHSSAERFAEVKNRFAALEQRLKPLAILRGSCATAIDHAINQAARKHGIPVISWQHGAVYYKTRITQFCDYADRMSADFVLVNGNEVERAFREFGYQFPGTVIPVGSPSLENVRAHCQRLDDRRSTRGLRILYATTCYMQNHWYMGWEPAFSDRLFYRDQAALAAGLVNLQESDGCKIIIKLHPNRSYLTPPWVAQYECKPGIEFARGTPTFQELLTDCDAVVLDFPSTTLLQALATSLPVFVLTRHLHFPKDVQEVLKRRAMVAEDTTDLAAMLRRFVQSGSYAAETSDAEFLTAYATHRNDGQAARRVFEVIRDQTLGRTAQRSPDRISPVVQPPPKSPALH